jgi:hypothetical protein
MHMVDAMSTPGTTGDWSTLLSLIRVFLDLILEMKGVILSHRFTLYTVTGWKWYDQINDRLFLPD